MHGIAALPARRGALGGVSWQVGAEDETEQAMSGNGVHEVDSRDSGLTDVLLGPKPVSEALKEHGRIETVFVQDDRAGRHREILALCRESGARYKLLPRERMDALFPGNHQGVAARRSAAALLDLDEVLARTASARLPVALAMDQIQDPGNVGTLARTLIGIGAGGIILPKDRSASLGLGAVKASAGALSRVAVTRVVNLARALEQCRSQGFTVYCADQGEGSAEVYSTELRTPAVVVLGNEEKGVRPLVARNCDQLISIPLVGMESLNVAQAGAMLLGEFYSRMLKGGGQRM
jgi:23S rRNA (guanosine2251-2'-O)-methyltransferase